MLPESDPVRPDVVRLLGTTPVAARLGVGPVLIDREMKIHNLCVFSHSTTSRWPDDIVGEMDESSPKVYAPSRTETFAFCQPSESKLFAGLQKMFPLLSPSLKADGEKCDSYKNGVFWVYAVYAM